MLSIIATTLLATAVSALAIEKDGGNLFPMTGEYAGPYSFTVENSWPLLVEIYKSTDSAAAAFVDSNMDPNSYFWFHNSTGRILWNGGMDSSNLGAHPEPTPETPASKVADNALWAGLPLHKRQIITPNNIVPIIFQQEGDTKKPASVQVQGKQIAVETNGRFGIVDVGDMAYLTFKGEQDRFVICKTPLVGVVASWKTQELRVIVGAHKEEVPDGCQKARIVVTYNDW